MCNARSPSYLLSKVQILFVLIKNGGSIYIYIYIYIYEDIYEEIDEVKLTFDGIVIRKDDLKKMNFSLESKIFQSITRCYQRVKYACYW